MCAVALAPLVAAPAAPSSTGAADPSGAATLQGSAGVWACSGAATAASSAAAARVSDRHGLLSTSTSSGTGHSSPWAQPDPILVSAPGTTAAAVAAAVIGAAVGAVAAPGGTACCHCAVPSSGQAAPARAVLLAAPRLTVSTAASGCCSRRCVSLCHAQSVNDTLGAALSRPPHTAGAAAVRSPPPAWPLLIAAVLVPSVLYCPETPGPPH